ncbi:MAG TPA: GNAT family N-acetyltransferase [Egicoccus sp.]|nr:GNAT family N-acetyltransferase [Egicoccus sp.]HSK24765.1 GNAT family N-acetyltransferase [Egicoccus sp.]
MDIGGVRRATADDWAQVRDLRLAALADVPDAFGTSLEDERDRPESWWRARLEAADAVTLVAWIDDRPAGLTVVAPAYRDPHAGGVYSVWVAPDARGRGVGSRLLAAALSAAAELGHRRVLLDVGDHNTAAQRLYAGAGFRPTGRVGSLPPPREHVTEHELGRTLEA